MPGNHPVGARYVYRELRRAVPVRIFFYFYLMNCASFRLT